MTAYTDAIAALNLFNSGTYSSSNLYGYSGTGGMDANWVPTLRAVATVAAGVAAISGTIASSQSTLSMAWDTGTTDANPGAGKLRGNGPSASATYLYISTTDSAAVDVSATLAAMGASTSSIKARARLVKASDSSVYADFNVTGVTAATGYYKLAVEYLAGSGSFAAADAVALGFVQTGWKGDTGDAGTLASETVAGVAKIATQAETNAATNDTNFITPLKLDARLTGAVILQGRHVLGIKAHGFRPRATNGPSVGSVETATNNIRIDSLDFDTATAERAQLIVAMPGSWDGGTVTASFVMSTASVTGVAVFGLRAVAILTGSSFDAAFGTGQTATVTISSALTPYLSSETQAITIAGSPAPRALVCFEVYRDVEHESDTLAADVRLQEVNIFYTVNQAEEP